VCVWKREREYRVEKRSGQTMFAADLRACVCVCVLRLCVCGRERENEKERERERERECVYVFGQAIFAVELRARV